MLTVTALFTKNSGAPATGLALAEIDLYLYRRTKADGTVATIWNAQQPTEEIGGGLYSKAYTLDDLSLYTYYGAATYTGAEVLDSNYSLYSGGGEADPLLNAVPGAYVAGTAGNALGSIAAIKAKTDLITTGTALTVVSPVDGATITATIGATLAATISGLTISATWTKVYLTVKQRAADADAASILQLVVSNPAAAATDGALYVLKAAATVAQRTLAALTVTQAAGTVAIALDEVLTGALREYSGLAYDLKEITTAGAANVLCAGTWNLVYTPTWAVA